MHLRYVVRAFAGGLVHRPLLLIYQMGKVGSQTIEATLRNALPGRRIHRPHFLSSQHVALVSRRLNFETMSARAKDSLRRQIEEANLLRHAILARRRLRGLGLRVEKVKIIAGVRDPVGLMLASIFQNNSAYFESLDHIDATGCRELLLGRSTHAERREYIAQLQRTIHNWFDNELKRVIGLNVYETPFPQDKGYCLYENKFARILVYRFENLQILGKMIEEFLGVKVPAIVNHNLSSTKNYAAQYDAVRSSLRLPAEFLEQQYSSKLAAHFYSEAERARFSMWWQGARGSGPQPPRKDHETLTPSRSSPSL
jgi:hypothetical protein